MHCMFQSEAQHYVHLHISTEPILPICQGWGVLILEGHSPAEFSSNAEKTLGKNT